MGRTDIPSRHGLFRVYAEVSAAMIRLYPWSLRTIRLILPVSFTRASRADDRS